MFLGFFRVCCGVVWMFFYGVVSLLIRMFPMDVSFLNAVMGVSGNMLFVYVSVFIMFQLLLMMSVVVFPSAVYFVVKMIASLLCVSVGFSLFMSSFWSNWSALFTFLFINCNGYFHRSGIHQNLKTQQSATTYTQSKKR